MEYLLNGYENVTLNTKECNITKTLVLLNLDLL
jgi:hypothetical protein